MRIVLMLLILANLGVFAWQRWYGGDGNDLTAGRVDSPLEKSLTLVGEAPAPVSEAEDVVEAGVNPSPLEAKPPEVVASVACATLGPFEQPEVAEVARDRLADLGIAATPRESGGQIRSGFWVYLPPLDSRDAAEEVADELRARNVGDLFIVTGSPANGQQQNAISLGLFSTPERADQRAAEIGRLGYTPRVVERFRDATVYWVDFRERPDVPLEPETIGVMGAGETLPEKHSISCADIATGAGGA